MIPLEQFIIDASGYTFSIIGCAGLLTLVVDMFVGVKKGTIHFGRLVLYSLCVGIGMGLLGL